MKKIRVFCLVLTIFVLAGCLTGPVRAEEADQSVTNGCHTPSGSQPLAESKKLLDTSKAVILYERKSDTLVYAWNPDGKIYPSSMVKLMTALVALERGNLTDKVTVTRRALDSVAIGSVSAGLVSGEEITLKDLLYCMMTASANDASAVIAEHIGGSQEAFCQLMNEKAAELGCKGTQFSNAHGLHDAQTYTSARDICIITDAALDNPQFREMFNAKSYTVPATNKSEARQVESTNYMMTTAMNRKYLDSRVTGGKTGATDQAGRCLVLTAEEGSMELLAIVMGAEPVYESDHSIKYFGSFEEMKILLDYGFQNFEYRQVFSADQTMTQYPVSGGANHVVTRPMSALATVLPKNMEQDKIRWVYGDVTQTITAPVAEGQKITYVQLWYGQICLAQTDLVAFRDVELHQSPPEPGQHLQTNESEDSWKLLILVLGAIAGAGILVVAVIAVAKGMKKLFHKGRRLRRRFARRRKF